MVSVSRHFSALNDIAAIYNLGGKHRTGRGSDSSLSLLCAYTVYACRLEIFTSALLISSKCSILAYERKRREAKEMAIKMKTNKHNYLGRKWAHQY
jgi:hypothetical protein